MLIFKKVSSDGIRCPQMSERLVFRERNMPGKQGYGMRRKGEEAGTGAKGGLCRAEGAEVPVFSWGGVFFIRHCQVCPYIPYFQPDLWGYKGGPPFFINDTVMRRVGRSESL